MSPEGRLFRKLPRRALRLTAIAALSLSAAFAFAETTNEVTLGQARALAHLALSKGDADLALKLGKGLLAANPRDANAHAIVAAAETQRGDHGAARSAAGKAYRASTDPKARLKAAQFAARAALHEQRPTLTQIWLRRAATNTTNEADIKRIGADYARVRAMNPFSFRLSGGITPSNNVNNGADSALQIIDGVPIVGVLSGSAQALSGMVATTDVAVGYRLAQSAVGSTVLGARVYVRRVALSDEAKVLAPTVRNADFGSTYANLSLDRHFRLGAKGNTASVGVTIGRSWSGGDVSHDFASIRASRAIKLSPRTRLSFDLSVEERKSAIRASQDQTLTQIGTRLSHKLDKGDTVGLGLSLSEVDAGHINTRSTAASLRASYSFGKAIGPAHVTTSLTLGQTEYPDYRVGWISVPGGRKDTSLYGDVTLFFADYDYAGFAPSVRFRAGKRNSNVSRYDSREFSIAFEIRSRF